MDAEIAKSLQRLLQKQGFAFKPRKPRVRRCQSGNAGVALALEAGARAAAAARSLNADVVLVAVRAAVRIRTGLGLDTAGGRTSTTRGGSRFDGASSARGVL